MATDLADSFRCTGRQHSLHSICSEVKWIKPKAADTEVSWVRDVFYYSSLLPITFVERYHVHLKEYRSQELSTLDYSDEQ